MKNKIFLKKSIVENKDITSEGILVYAGLVIMSENKIDKLFTSLSAIEFALKLDFTKEDRYFKDKIKRGLIDLAEKGIINIISKNSDFKPNDVLAIKLLEFNIDTEKERFIVAYAEEIYKIIGYSEKKFENENLLRYYLVFLGTINNSTKVGFTTIDNLAEKSCIGFKVVATKYNPILEELKLIYIHRHDSCIRYDDGTIRKVNNTYGRYSDKEYIIKNASEYNTVIDRYNSTLTGNEARSIKQRYNSLQKKINNGYIPSEEEISNMNNCVKRYNIKYKNTEIKELELIQLHL